MRVAFDRCNLGNRSGFQTGMKSDSYPHHMLREIHEEPEAASDTLKSIMKQSGGLRSFLSRGKYQMIYTTGSGTSYHAGLAGQYAIGTLTKRTASSISASEFRRWIPMLAREFLLLAFSQSGESVDVLDAVRAALDRQARILAITNTPKSSLSKLAGYVLLTRAGNELAVTATKTFISQLAAAYLLSLELGTRSSEVEQRRTWLLDLPDLIEKTIKLNAKPTEQLAEKHKDKSFFFILGSGPNYVTALEGALKLKEACNVFAEGFATREFLHGPVQLVNERTPIVLIAPPYESQEESISLIKDLRRFGAPLIAVSEEKGEIGKACETLLRVPKAVPEMFSPILNVVPLQLLAYYLSVSRGLNPDKPEKLSKVVR